MSRKPPLNGMQVWMLADLHICLQRWGGILPQQVCSYRWLCQGAGRQDARASVPPFKAGGKRACALLEHKRTCRPNRPPCRLAALRKAMCLLLEHAGIGPSQRLDRYVPLAVSPLQRAGKPLYRSAFNKGLPEGEWFNNPLDLKVKDVANTQ